MSDLPRRAGSDIWSVDHGRLVFRPRGGGCIYPTAAEVWALVFAKATTVNQVDVELSPTGALPQLSFSRFPAAPVLLLSGSLQQGIQADIAVKTDEDVTKVLSSDSGQLPDQVVV